MLYRICAQSGFTITRIGSKTLQTLQKHIISSIIPHVLDLALISGCVQSSKWWESSKYVCPILIYEFRFQLFIFQKEGEAIIGEGY